MVILIIIIIIIRIIIINLGKKPRKKSWQKRQI